MAMTDTERELLLQLGRAYRLYIPTVTDHSAIPGGVPRAEMAEVIRLMTKVKEEAELRAENDSAE